MKLEQMPWDMEYDGRWQTRDYLARAKANQ